jgi:hypothetical protein
MAAFLFFFFQIFFFCLLCSCSSFQVSLFHLFILFEHGERGLGRLGVAEIVVISVGCHVLWLITMVCTGRGEFGNLEFSSSFISTSLLL